MGRPSAGNLSFRDGAYDLGMPLRIKPSSLDRVRDTFVDVLFAKERAASLFYNHLFVLAPETRALFRSDLEEQGRMFVEALSRIVTGLDRLEVMLPELEALAVRHVGYGVEERHYAVVGAALLHMVRELSHPKFDADTENAWFEAYGLVSAAMLKATLSGQRAGDASHAHAPNPRPLGHFQATQPASTRPQPMAHQQRTSQTSLRSAPR
jgi:hemoglobin-like flavoprotein